MSSENQAPIFNTRTALLRNIPVFLALLAIGGIYWVISDRFALGPPWLMFAIAVVVIIIFVIAIELQKFVLRRSAGLLLLGVVTLAEAVSTSGLVTSVVLAASKQAQTAPTDALALLRDSALLWLVNVLTFAFWYWELDGGGPARRNRHGYTSQDFVFPQVQCEQDDHWRPHFIDYLFLAFNTSTAFSPTDTLVLSKRAKLLMMVQAADSLVLLAIIAARAVNTL